MSDHPTAIEAEIIRLITTSFQRITPSALQHHLRKTFGLNTGECRRIIHNLLATQQLVYVYQFGCSFLELSFDKPVHITQHLVLTPPAVCYHPSDNEVVLKLVTGSAFGDGRHPTTQLAAQGVELVLAHKSGADNWSNGVMLDIGTGSGILLIAALKMGMQKGVGIDTDVCARFEALANVRLNGLSAQAVISDQCVENIRQHFDLVTANLRMPTLVRLQHHLKRLVRPGGHLVLSGIKVDERETIMRDFAARQLLGLWEANVQGWTAVLFQKQT